MCICVHVRVTASHGWSNHITDNHYLFIERHIPVLHIKKFTETTHGILSRPFLWFCRTWTKRYLITSQTRVKRVSRIHHHKIPNFKKTFRVGGPQSPLPLSSSFVLFFVLLPFFLSTKMNTSCEPQFNGFYVQRPRWAGASEPRCTSSQAGIPTIGQLSPSPIGNLDPVDDRGNAGEGASSAKLFWGWSGGVSG